MKIQLNMLLCFHSIQLLIELMIMELIITDINLYYTALQESIIPMFLDK
jgi:hypothetical protein